VIRAAILVGLLLAATGLEAGRKAPPAAAREPDAPRLRLQQHREELFKRVDAYLVSHLQDRLELSDDQLAKVLPLVRKLQSDRRHYAERRHELLARLERQLESGRTTQEAVGETMKEVRALEAERPAALRKDVEALDAVLSPLQQAKLRVLELQVEQRIRELRGRIREQQGKRRRLRPGPAPLE